MWRHFLIKGQKYEFTALTLREANHKDEIDGEESDEICSDHFVDHLDKRTNEFEAPASRHEGIND